MERRKRKRENRIVVEGGLPGGGFFFIVPAIVQALSGRLSARFPGFFGGKRVEETEPKEEALDATLLKQSMFWVGLLTTVSNSTSTPITEIKKMDVFEFFALVTVVEERKKK